MKRKGIYLLLALACAACCVYAGCSGDGDSTDSTPAAPEETITVDLNKKELTLEKLETFQLTASVGGEAVTVQWTTTDPSVATVENGLVTAVGAGTVAINATYEGVQERCIVTVEDHGYVPVIQLNVEDDVLNVGIGDTFDVAASVTYNNKPCDDAQISFELVSDGAASLEGSTVKGLALGEAQLAVTVAWRGVTAQKVVQVNVVTMLVANLLDDAELSLYAMALNGEKTREALNITVMEEGVELSESAYTVEYDAWDTSVVTLENGYFVAQAAGNTEIAATVTSTATGSSVRVTLPVVVKVVEVDKSAAVELEPVNLAVGSYFLAAEDVFAGLSSDVIDGLEIVGITDVTDDVAVGVPYSEDRVYTKDVSASAVGVRKWKIDSQKISYTVSVTVATKVIETAEDFNAMQTSYGNNATEENFYTWGGYFILGNDISFKTGDVYGTVAIKAMNETSETERGIDPTIGFQGVFDGRGHSISGFTVERYTKTNRLGSLFGNIGEKGVVKNFTVKDFKTSMLIGTDSTSSVAWSVNKGTIEGVNVIYNGADIAHNHGFLAFRVIAGSTFKNVNVFSSAAGGFAMSVTFTSTAVNFVNVNTVTKTKFFTGVEATSKELGGYINHLFYTNHTFVKGEDTKMMSHTGEVEGLSFQIVTNNQVAGAAVTSDGILTVDSACEAAAINVTVLWTLAGESLVVNAPLTEYKEVGEEFLKYTAADNLTVASVSGDTAYACVPQSNGSMHVQLQPAAQASVYTITLPKINYSNYKEVTFTMAYATSGTTVTFEGAEAFVLARNTVYTITVKANADSYDLLVNNVKYTTIATTVADGTDGLSFNVSRGGGANHILVLTPFLGIAK